MYLCTCTHYLVTLEFHHDYPLYESNRIILEPLYDDNDSGGRKQRFELKNQWESQKLLLNIKLKLEKLTLDFFFSNRNEKEVVVSSPF